MSTASAGVLAIWILSLALLLPGTPISGTPQAGLEVSRTALVALAWMALAGVPRARDHRSGPGPSGAHWPGAAVCALALAPLAVALTLDHATGYAVREIALTAGVAAVLFLALGFGAARGGTWYAVLWLVVVLGAPILVSILAWGASGPPHPALATLRSASPLAWCYDRASGAAAHPGLPLATCAALLAVAYRQGARRAS